MKQSEKYVPHFHGLVQINTTYFYHSLCDHWYNRSLSHYSLQLQSFAVPLRRLVELEMTLM